MPPNVYGPNDNYDLSSSHVLPALIRKFDEAKATGGPVEVWGSGRPRREFLYSDDAADGIHFLLQRGGIEGFVNLGTGQGISIRELAETVQRVVGHQGEMTWKHLHARWLPREDDGRDQAARARLAPPDRARGRHPRRLRLVPGERRPRARPASARASAALALGGRDVPPQIVPATASTSRPSGSAGAAGRRRSSARRAG